MKLINLFTFCTVVTSIMVSKAVVTVNDKSIELGEFNTQELKFLPLESSKDTIDIEIYLDQVATQPHQMMISFGNDDGLDWWMFPKYNVAKKALKLAFTASKFPLAIRNLNTIQMKLILSDSDHANNLIMYLGGLSPTTEFQTLVPYVKAQRIGIKPIINHVFKTDPQTINPLTPIIFIAINSLVFIGLLFSWFTIPTIFNGFKGISSLQLLNNATFLTLIMGYEFIFVKYYLGQSIFKTLSQCFILSGPVIVLGSRTFRWLGGLRSIGRA